MASIRLATELFCLYLYQVFLHVPSRIRAKGLYSVGHQTFEIVISVTRLGVFLQVPGNKLSHKIRPNNLLTFWATSYNVIFM